MHKWSLLASFNNYKPGFKPGYPPFLTWALSERSDVVTGTRAITGCYINIIVLITLQVTQGAGGSGAITRHS